MELTLRKGGQTVTIVTGYNLEEEHCTWHEVLDDLVWPALRAFGYIIDHDFTDSIADEHSQYVSDKLRARTRDEVEDEVPF